MYLGRCRDQAIGRGHWSATALGTPFPCDLNGDRDYSAAKCGDDIIQPTFERPRLPMITALTLLGDAAADLADGQHGEAELLGWDAGQPLLHAGILRALLCLR